MADIKNKINYSDSQFKIIEKKLGDPTFSYKNWGDDDLSKLRSTIRGFYRKEQIGSCAYCKNPVSLISASNCHVEHITPKFKYRDFIFEPKNLCVICSDCNEIKRGQETIGEVIDPLKKGPQRKHYPRTSGAFKIVHPHFDNYEDHILILNRSYYIDKSVKGNFTIYACKLNRRLYAFGWEKGIVEETELINLMNTYMEEKNALKRLNLLQELKKMLIQT